MARAVTGGVVSMRDELERHKREAEASAAVAKKAGNKMQVAFERGRIDAYNHALAIMHQ